MPIGAMVTLRGQRMYEFLDRLVSMALPRIRDFRGVSPNSFDGRGNYTLGLREQIAFPEIDYDRIDKMRGLEVSIVTTAQNDEEGRRLLAQARHAVLPTGPAAVVRRLRREQKTWRRRRQIVQGEPARQVSDPAGQPLQDLWARPGVHAEVRRLPDLLPRAGLVWPAPGRDQVELVTSRERETKVARISPAR